MTAVRREAAKYGRDSDLVDFDCLFYCMGCGHLSEPSSGDPMRREAGAAPRNCEMCGSAGLIDLRQTRMVQSLSGLEASDPNPSRAARVAKALGVVGMVAMLTGVIAMFGGGLFGGVIDKLEAGFLVLPTLVFGGALIARALVAVTGPGTDRPRRVLPRRWRMPQTAKRRNAASSRARGQAQAGELLRAPLSGRPCIAYEVAVRDDADPASSFSSWRLIEQDNVAFRVDDVEVARGEALLQLRRELVSDGIIGSAGETTTRFMRTRGLLDSEDVYVYETILEPGASCAISRRSADAPVVVRS